MRPTHILFIGSSFTHRNDLPAMVVRLAAAASSPRAVHTERVIANGQSLKAHWNRAAAREAIQGSPWDYVVLQEQSTGPLKHRQRMDEFVRLFDAEVRQRGAKTVLYMTWARRHEFNRQAELAEAYLSLGKQLGCIVAPVGTAWASALSANPSLVLHDRDNSHPNMAGSYLAACVFFATLFGQNPVGLRTRDVGAGAVGEETAAILQKVAWTTVHRIA